VTKYLICFIHSQDRIPSSYFRYGEITLKKAKELFAPCKGIRIPESRNFLPVESGILGFGIRNPALGIRNPTKDWNPESNLLKIHSRLKNHLWKASPGYMPQRDDTV